MTSLEKGIEMKSPDEFQRHSLTVKMKENMAGGKERAWGTIIPQGIRRKVNYEIELYKNFAGIDLRDDSVDLDKPPAGDDTTSAQEPFNPTEDWNGVGNKPMTEIARVTTAGVNSWWKTYFFLVKGFLGSGMLTLPMGFCNGGALFSIGCMAVVCAFSIMGMVALLEARNVSGGGYSDIAEAALGKVGKLVVEISIACCQVLLPREYRLDIALFT